MVISEALYLRTGRPVFLERAKRWSRGAAILFAVGAVSGTVVSFELGLLWPGFMEKSGAIDSMFIRSRIGLQNSFNFSNCLRIILRAVI
jgi:cytochrome d ubiquinol oxidase subunit I